MIDLSNLPIPHPRYRPSMTEIKMCTPVIEDLERRIKKIQNEVNKLGLEIRALQRRKANYVSYAAPLRRLPPEILSIIITSCLEQGVKLTVLTQSCGIIRDTVLGMTAIWRNIHLLSEFDSHSDILTYGEKKEVKNTSMCL
jgi:hypothetical protein